MFQEKLLGEEEEEEACLCTVMTYSLSHSPENLGFSVLNASCGHTASVLELQKRAKMFICDVCK
jgi:hypothetical protein